MPYFHAKSLAAAKALVLNTSDAAWPSVWSVIEACRDFGRKLLGEVTYRLRSSEESLVAKLGEQASADLFLWLLAEFPVESDPKREGAAFLGKNDCVRFFRDDLLRALENRGTVDACECIERICQELPDCDWMKSVLARAREVTARTSWLPLEPNELLELVKDSATVLIRNASDLQREVLKSLGRLEQALHDETPEVGFLWDQTSRQRGAQSWEPKIENSLSDYVKSHLRRDMGALGVISAREVEIRRSTGGAPGEETDIHVMASVQNPMSGQCEQIQVIIEVKGCWHPELDTAMKDQLVDRYLKDNACRHGIYLIGWYDCPQWRDGRMTLGIPLDEARVRFAEQAESLCRDGLQIEAFVLDTALR